MKLLKSSLLGSAAAFAAVGAAHAADLPVKKAVPIERALSIIESEVKAGKCDPELFRVFVQAEVYKRVI